LIQQLSAFGLYVVNTLVSLIASVALLWNLTKILFYLQFLCRLRPTEFGPAAQVLCQSYQKTKSKVFEFRVNRVKDLR